MTVRRIACLFACLVFSPALAAERGCDKFAWSLDRERMLLTSADKLVAPSGSEVGEPRPRAITLQLKPLQEAKLPIAPERAPKLSDSFAGYLNVNTLGRQPVTMITLSDDDWIDVVQAGHYLKPAGFTGALECPGIRKSMKFAVPAGSFVVQISGSAKDTIGIVITEAE